MERSSESHVNKRKIGFSSKPTNYIQLTKKMKYVPWILQDMIKLKARSSSNKVRKLTVHDIAIHSGIYLAVYNTTRYLFIVTR